MQWAVTPFFSLQGDLERASLMDLSVSVLLLAHWAAGVSDGPGSSWTGDSVSFIWVIWVPIPDTVHLCFLCLQGGVFNHKLTLISFSCH